MSLAEPLQVAMENGARRALIPLGNKRNVLEVSGEIAEKVDPIFSPILNREERKHLASFSRNATRLDQCDQIAGLFKRQLAGRTLGRPSPLRKSVKPAGN